MEIYVIVKVTYDWYRFQENIAATDCVHNFNWINLNPHGLPVYDYDVDDKKSAELNRKEQHHFWIQKFSA